MHNKVQKYVFFFVYLLCFGLVFFSNLLSPTYDFCSLFSFYVRNAKLPNKYILFFSSLALTRILFCLFFVCDNEYFSCVCVGDFPLMFVLFSS